MKRSFIREILESIDHETISFAGGLPNEELFPIKDLAKASEKVFSNPKAMQYSTTNGIKELREQIAKMYCDDGFPTVAENILITSGSQQAMYIIAKFFEGKAITIEEPSYLGAMNIFKLNKMKIDSCSLDEEGVKEAEFREKFIKSALAYLIPDFQNPSSKTYSQTKREFIANTVKKFNGLLIEDSPYSELYFDKKREPISKLIPQNSFHLGSFSKTLVPSLRVGWIRADERLIKSLLIIKESIDLHSSGISQYILSEYLKDGHKYKAHLDSLREKYKDKMNIFCDGLDKYLPEFEYKRPSGGMFVYGSLNGVDTKAMVEKCMARKVVYVPGSEFYINPNINSEIRFNFTHATKESVEQGLERIRKACYTI